MTRIRTALVSAVAIASVLAGGVAMHGHAASHASHHLAGPVPCCRTNSTHVG
jgi:hypothetical protein